MDPSPFIRSGVLVGSSSGVKVTVGFLVGKAKVGEGVEGIEEGVSVGTGPTLKQPVIIIVTTERSPSAVARFRENREQKPHSMANEHC